jgi:TRAP-type uncharacterized transport system substrate-binding protein
MVGHEQGSEMATEKNTSGTKKSWLARWSKWMTFVAGFVGVVLVVWLFSEVFSMQQRTVVMATYPEGSLTAELTKRYQTVLARKGISVKLVLFAGAVESVARLQDPKSGVDVALIPGGTTTEKESPDLVSLGTTFYQPIWVFLRRDLRKRNGQQLKSNTNLKGLHVSIGPRGSSSRALSLNLLGRAGVIDRESATLFSFSPSESAEKLIRGEIDGAIFVDGWDSPALQRLMSDENVELQSIRRADAFDVLYPYLGKLVLPAGVADMRAPRPPTDVLLVATKSSLVVRRDMHAAVQYMLLEAAVEIHSTPGIFRTAGQFPAPESVDLPLSPYAREFYKTGTPILLAHLPFWLAALLGQPVVWLIPVIIVLFPLVRVAPAVYDWVERRRVYRLYAELRGLEDEMQFAVPGHGREDLVERLDLLKDKAAHLSVPTAFKPLVYSLRWHIDMIRDEAKKELMQQQHLREGGAEQR